MILRDRLSPFATFALSLDISRLNIHNLCTKEKEMNKKKKTIVKICIIKICRRRAHLEQPLSGDP